MTNIDNEQEKKRQEKLKQSYLDWQVKSKRRLIVATIIFIVLLAFNFIFIKNSLLTKVLCLLFLAFAVYSYSLIWFINKHLLDTGNKKRRHNS